MNIHEGVQSSLLSSFCDGKSISTYFHVLICSYSFQHVAFTIIRDALVDRYSCLAKENDKEARDVLDIIREDVRTFKDTHSIGGTLDYTNGMVTKISEWCAIVDYFDRMRAQSGVRAREFIIWCGQLETRGFGKMEQACVSTLRWTVTAMDHFYDQLELSNHYLTHPATQGLPTSVVDIPFGKLEVNSESDDAVLQRILYSLNLDVESPRYSFLVPSHLEYEPTMGFSLNDTCQRRSLICYWDEDDMGDFEYSLSRLGENSVRILSRLDEKK